MGAVFTALGKAVTRQPIVIIVLWAILTGFAGTAAMTGFGDTPLFSKLETGQPTVPGSDSAKVDQFLYSEAAGVSASLMIQGVDLKDPDVQKDVRAAMKATRKQLKGMNGVAKIDDPFQHPDGITADEAAPFISTNSDAFLVRTTLETGLSAKAEKERVAEVEAELEAIGQQFINDGLAEKSQVSSITRLMASVNHQMEQDLIKGELIALPVSLFIMVIVFGGVLAAGMPIIGALASIAAGLGSIWGLSYAMDLDSVVINVVTLLGLGLSIDYGLLIVSRFREELRNESTRAEADSAAEFEGAARKDPRVIVAMERTIQSAGRTVFFSALTIAICVAGLMAMSPSLLKGLGMAGSIVVVIALLTAITLVPSVLVLTGRWLMRPPLLSKIPVIGKLFGQLGGVPPERGAFSALATGVQKHPWVVMITCIAILLIAASPVTGIHLRNSGVDVLPEDNPERVAIENVSDNFPYFSQPDVWIVPKDRSVDFKVLYNLWEELPKADGIASVDRPIVTESAPGRVFFGLRLDDGIKPDSKRAVEIVEDLRSMNTWTSVYVGGQAAGQIDFAQALKSGLPTAAGLVILATFILLFLMTGSVLVPLKALLTNVLSITATIGIVTWLFQEGHGAKLLGFESVGGLESYVVAVVIAFGFGLAMDYEVFLLARIKEYYDSGMSNDEAVVRGLQSTGRIITSAALVIIVVFAGFAAGELLAIKEAGVALAIAVALDATLVRMLLVPATMTVLGDLNWWAPRWLKPVARRFAIQH